jgi:hypothetical protein
VKTGLLVILAHNMANLINIFRKVWVISPSLI